MKSVVGLLGLVMLWMLLGAGAPPASAEEFIRSYHSDISIATDATLTVTETITVRSEGRDIRRGIFRDFPLRMRAPDGKPISAEFELLSVERDGEPEAYHTESISGGIRIYAGSADVSLRPGDHTYAITYTTSRWILRYDDQDELYWNVNGNGWQFPVRSVSATVHLPDGAEPTSTDFFTGSTGDEGKDAEASVSGSDVEFQTTRPLGAQQGLTILVGMPKGVLDEPTGGQAFAWFLRDNADWLIGGLGLIVVLGYYFRSWSAVGRDPEGGVVVPRWDAPDNLSPALVNYVDNKGFSGGGWTAFSATLIDLAVKGHVELDDLDSAITIRATGKSVDASKLAAGQRSLIKDLADAGGTLVIDKANGTKVQSIGSRFRDAIEKEHRGKYYRHNIGYIIGGVALSVAFILALIVFGNMSDDAVPLVIIPVFFAVFLGIMSISVGKGLRRGASILTRIVSTVILGVVGFVAISVLATVVLTVVFEVGSTAEFFAPIAVAGIVFVNILFFFLMGAPTPIGRKLMDGIEGLRTYLTLAEKDRMNTAGAPAMSPQHFETLLPYAVALGVEKPWSRAFEAWLATAAAGAAAATAFSPGWYHGGSLGGFSDRIGGFSSSMASTISSTLPAPKSSSGSSGGFSGGGGGGGGGGGW